MKIKDENLFKQIFEVEMSDLVNLLGEHFLNLLNETNQELLDVLTTKININSTGNNMYEVYLNENIIVRSERHFSMVNTYNVLRHGKIKTYIPSTIEG